MGALTDFFQSASNAVASNVSAPVDGISWLMRKAGFDPGPAPVGGSDWMRKTGLTADVAPGLASMLGETAGMLTPFAAAAKAPQIARTLLQGADNLAAPAALNKQAGVFIGPGAKTWNAEKAAKAQQMADQGAAARDIWPDTGTWKGPDGMWRQELADNNAALQSPQAMADLAKSYQLRQQEIKTAISGSKAYPDLFPKELTAAQKALRAESSSYKAPLTEYFGLSNGAAGAKAKYAYPHPGGLYSAYPDIGESVVIRQGGSDGNFVGSYQKNQLDVNALASAAEGGVNSTTAHEMQHAVQGREGFAGGGNSHAETMQLLHDAIENYEVGGLSRSEATARVNENAKYYNEMGMQNYRHLAGEAEARATQTRLNLTPQQRLATFPADSYDVPLDQLIIRK